MAYKFNVGEIAIFIPEADRTDEELFSYANTEMEILKQGHPIEALDQITPVKIYLTRSCDGQLLTIREPSLRKLPPKDDITSWEEVRKTTGWAPKPVLLK